MRWGAWLPAVAAAVLFAGPGCAGEDLSTGEASAVIRGHLSTLAPHGIDDAWEDVRVEVESVAAPSGDASEREVAFRAYRPGGAGRGPAFRVVLSAEGGGWAVERYGPGLRHSVALMVARDRRTRYGEMVGALTSLQDTAAQVFRAWSRPRKFARRDHDDPDRIAQLEEELARGIPAEHLRDGLASRHPGVPAGLSWGVVEAPGTGEAVVVWVGDAEERDVRCAQRIGSSEPGAAWAWLDGRFITCAGRDARYVQRDPPVDVIEEIERGGGVLRVPAEAGGTPAP